MPLRAAIYARVSSAAQRDRHTIGSQLRVLPDFVAARGWELVRPATHYVDDGRTAKAGHLDGRDGLRRLLDDAAAGLFEVVAVVDLDRLTRSEDPGERGQILGAFYRAHVQIAIASTGQVLDLSSSVGDLYSGLQAFFAAEENRKRRERSTRGRLEAARKGKKANGPTPYGLRYDRFGGGRWWLDEAEAAVIRECFERVAGGESCNRVGDDLAARGVARPRRGRWSRGRVYQLIASSTYRGAYVAHKALGILIAVPRIVSDDLWYRAQAMLPSSRPGRQPRARHVSLLEGIARCGTCGGRIGIRIGKGHRYYVCAQRREAGGAGRCPNPTWRVDALDPLVWDHLRRTIEQPDLFGLALDSREDGADADHYQAELASYQRQLAALERAEAVILEAFRRGRVSQGAMGRELDAAGRQRALLDRNRELAAQGLAAAQRSCAETDALRASFEGLRARLAGAEAEERRALARLLIPGTDALHATLLPDRRVELAGRLNPAAGVVVPRSSERPHLVENSTAWTNAQGAVLFRVFVG